MSLLPLCSLVAGVGVLSHLFYFRIGEHLIPSPTYVKLALTAPLVLFVLLYILREQTVWQSSITTTALYWSFMGGVFSSVTLYRAFFHPLQAYSGPFLARVSQFYLPFNVSERANSAWFINSLHQKYGDYFRLGPNLLSVSDPDMVEIVYGPGSRFTKGQWYDVSKPLTTVQQCREPYMHSKRRRDAWDPAFTTKSLRSYDTRVIKYTDRLVSQLRDRSGQPVNASHWLMFFSFDVMGDLGFGRDFGVLESGKSHPYIDTVHVNGRAFGTLGSVSWLMHCLMMLIPESMTPMRQMLLHSRESIAWRKANEPSQPDIMTFLLNANPFMSNQKDEELLLEGDVRLILIAGSDTTATALTYLFYYLAKDPSLVQRLREELKEHKITQDQTISIPALQKLPFLNAVMTEVLRIRPPVPGGTQRKSPPEGITVKGHYIPPEIQVLMPMHTVMRSPRAFVQPDEFIPERWTTRPELVLNKGAYFPFSIGSDSCVGKQLAYNEIRTVVTKLILEFDIALAPGETGHALMNESEDVFTVACAPLNLVFTARDDPLKN